MATLDDDRGEKLMREYLCPHDALFSPMPPVKDECIDLRECSRQAQKRSRQTVTEQCN
jgi:hypothetical protein